MASRYGSYMTNTTAAQTIGLIAARINRGDTVEIEGEFRTVDDYATSAGRITWTFTDGGTYAIVPTRYVTALA